MLFLSYLFSGFHLWSYRTYRFHAYRSFKHSCWWRHKL